MTESNDSGYAAQTQDDERYRNPPRFHGVEGAPGMERGRGEEDSEPDYDWQCANCELGFWGNNPTACPECNHTQIEEVSDDD